MTFNVKPLVNPITANSKRGRCVPAVAAKTTAAPRTKPAPTADTNATKPAAVPWFDCKSNTDCKIGYTCLIFKSTSWFGPLVNPTTANSKRGRCVPAVAAKTTAAPRTKPAPTADTSATKPPVASLCKSNTDCKVGYRCLIIKTTPVTFSVKPLVNSITANGKCVLSLIFNPVTKASVTEAPVTKAPADKCAGIKCPCRLGLCLTKCKGGKCVPSLIFNPLTKAPVTKAPVTKAPADKCALVKCRGTLTCKDGKCVKPVRRCPAANCKVYFDGCNTCTCGADGTLKRCAKKNTCAGDTSGQAKCRKSYPAPKTTRAPFAGSTDITCRGRQLDPKIRGSMTHIGTLEGCNRQANELNMITTSCGAKFGSFVCAKSSEVNNEFFVRFQGSIRECKARTKALTKGIAKFNLGTTGTKKVKFSCSGTSISVVFKRKTTLAWHSLQCFVLVAFAWLVWDCVILARCVCFNFMSFV